MGSSECVGRRRAPMAMRACSTFILLVSLGLVVAHGVGRRAGGPGTLTGGLSLSVGAGSNTAGNDESLQLGEDSCDSSSHKELIHKVADAKRRVAKAHKII